MPEMTEEQMVEALARAAWEEERVALADLRDAGITEAEQSPWDKIKTQRVASMFWRRARAELVYLRAHAEDVCRLLEGAGPKAVGFAREWLANAPDEGWPGQDDLRDALKEESDD